MPPKKIDTKPQDADEGRIEVEVLGHAGGDARQEPVVAATIETAVHLHPPIGLISTVPKLTVTREVGAMWRRRVVGALPVPTRFCSVPSTVTWLGCLSW